MTLPAGQPIQADLANAIHNIFMHPNVGPFIGKQLIQKLVTGNPSPQYVARVAAVFNNNGQGVRGDMKAVVSAILTDPEARGAVKLDPAYGKLREPVLFMTGAARALGHAERRRVLRPAGGQLGQNLFYPPSVFNYYPPTYVLPDTTRSRPEFAIQNSSTAINRYNFANTLVVRHDRAAGDACPARSARRPTGRRCRRSPAIPTRCSTSSMRCCCTARCPPRCAAPIVHRDQRRPRDATR